MVKAVTLISFILTIGILKVRGQAVIGQPQFDMSTKPPDVQALQKFIDMPVSYFTGTPNISIPVHDLISKGNHIAISLDYHGGGIKAEELSSGPGLGWTLNVGGFITRTVRGNRDEGSRHQFKRRKYTQTAAPGYYYRWDTDKDSLMSARGRYGGYYIDGGNSWTYSSLQSAIVSHNSAVGTGTYTGADDASNFFTGLDDGEPDLFYFNFGGYSGKFVLDPAGSPILVPYTQDFSIIPTMRTYADTEWTTGVDTGFFQSQFFESFKVSTPDGKDYYFGESATSRARHLSPGEGPYVYNGWMLTRVIDRIAMDTVLIEYSSVGGNTQVVKHLQKFISSDMVAAGCVNTGSIGYDQEDLNVAVPLKITSSKEVLNFYSNDSIIISDRISGIPYKKIQFDRITLLSGRMALAGITTKDLKTNEYYPYSFKYYDTAGWAGIWAQDYWGFYNGAANGHNLLIAYPGCSTGASNRSPAWPAMKQDALTEILYPTGGKTILEYEPHLAFSGRKPDNTIQESDAYYPGPYTFFSLPSIIGGLRIKRILMYDPVTRDTLIKRFSYMRPGNVNSSGFLYIPPLLISDVSSFACAAGLPGAQYYISTHPFYQGAGSGPHVSYTNVQVQEEKNGVINGHTEYDFYDDTNTDSCFYANAITDTTNSPLNGAYDVMPAFLFRKLPENFLSGKEKEKRVYNAAGDLLSREKTIYKSRVYGNAVSGAIINSVLASNICGEHPPEGSGGGAGGTMEWSYELITNPNGGPPILQKTVRAHDTNSGMQRPKIAPALSYYFFYPYKTRKTGIKLFQKITEMHASSTSLSIDTTTYSYDNAAHMNPTNVSSRSSKSEVTRQQTLYSQDFTDVNSGDSTFYFMRKAGMNVAIANFNYRNGIITSGGYRNYRYKSRIDSSIFIPSDEYSLNVTGNGLAPATLNITGILPQPYSLPVANFLNVASYKYNADNTISSVTKKGNDKTILMWDYSKNFVVAQTTGADSVDIAYTSFETPYTGNWIVAGSGRVINAITGTKSYNLSSGNITKSGLNTAKSYIVSYWSASSAATVNAVSGVAGTQKKGWQFYEHKLPVGTSSITISGTVIIDELRLQPVGAQMNTYAFDPMVGMTSSISPNSVITYYEYDNMARLRFVRDADNNIVKAAKYFYTVYGADTAFWRSAGGNTRTKPCPANAAYNTVITQSQQIDINPNSTTYGNLRWIDVSTCTSCINADWQNTATALRCAKDASNNNTGYQEQEQKDFNPCSTTYNQLRWVSSGLNTTACPIPPPPCVGADRMLIGGVCTIGVRVNTGSVFNTPMQKWACTYHYEWQPNCVKGSDITEYNTTACTPGNGCIPD